LPAVPRGGIVTPHFPCVVRDSGQPELTLQDPRTKAVFLLTLSRAVRARGGSHRILLLPWVDPTGHEWHHTNLKFGATRSVLHEKPESEPAAYVYPCTGDRHGAGFGEFPHGGVCPVPVAVADRATTHHGTPAGRGGNGSGSQEDPAGYGTTRKKTGEDQSQRDLHTLDVHEPGQRGCDGGGQQWEPHPEPGEEELPAC